MSYLKNRAFLGFSLWLSLYNSCGLFGVKVGLKLEGFRLGLFRGEYKSSSCLRSRGHTVQEKEHEGGTKGLGV